MTIFATLGSSFVLSETVVVMFMGGTGIGVGEGGVTIAGWQIV